MQLTTYLKKLYKLIWYSFHFQASKIIPNKSNENIFWEWLLDCLNDIQRNGWRNKMQFGFGLRWAKLIKDLPHETKFQIPTENKSITRCDNNFEVLLIFRFCNIKRVLKYKANNILSKSVFKDRKKIIGQFEIYCTLIWPRLKDEKEKTQLLRM